MKILKFGIAILSMFLVASLRPVLKAETISSFTSTVGTGGTQQGRLFRGSIPQDWIGTETFPGVTNTGVTYNYTTFSFSSGFFAGGANFVDISVYDELNNGNFFISAYANSYNPNNLAANWLGDEGASGNYFGKDPRFIDIVLPVGDSLVLVANNTAAGGVGNNAPFDIVVNAYVDTEFDDPTSAVTPEPSTFVMLGTGMLSLAAAARRRVRLYGGK